MSLQLAAKHLAKHGRGKDTELIHMDKGEIASLQQIAMANGGSLTINPQTGLPEAGFLSAILPMVAGAGLMMIPGMQAGAAGLIVGGLRTAQSGSLSKGIMAGLGAYGGAGMAGSFGTAGASQVGASATNQAASAAQGLEATQAAEAARNVASGATDMSLGQAGAANAANAANTANYVNPNYLDVGGSSAEFTRAGSSSPFSPGGLNVTAPTPAPIPAASTPQYNIDGMGLDSPTTAPTAGASTTPSSFKDMNVSQRLEAMKSGASFENAGNFIADNPKTAAAAALSVASGMKKDPTKVEPDKDMGQRYSFTGGKLEPTPAPDVPTYEDMLTKQGNFGRQRQYFNSPTYTAISPTAAKDLYNFANGGPVEEMSNKAMMGINTMYPMANVGMPSYIAPNQRMAEGGEAEESRPSYTYDAQTRKYVGGPSMGGASKQPQDFGASAGVALDNFANDVARDGITTPMGSVLPPSSNGIPSYAYNPQTRQYIQMAGGGISGNINFEAPQSQNAGPLEQLIRAIHAKQNGGGPMEEAKKYEYNPDEQQYVQQQASGGLSDARYNLGGYSDGGRLLRGPGDGVSDSIPAVIGKKQPARLADGEFVVPARIVSELGNGSTEAGARKLYAMMDRIQAARKKTVGKDKVAHNSRSSKYLPA